ncbi:MAG: hypothetical protein GY765_15900 [bacterium]|nr:hypothetical protein [bacterium]
MKINKKRIVTGIYSAALLTITLPQALHAYVDPGIIGMLFQAGFAILFGFLLAVVTKPFRLIRNLWRKITGKPPIEELKTVENADTDSHEQQDPEEIDTENNESKNNKSDNEPNGK